MTRREARELAVIVMFEKSFSDVSLDEVLENAKKSREMSLSKFALSLIEGTDSHLTEIDDLISVNSHNWKKERISRVSFAILRIAVFEMCFYDENPVSVAINEAVELSKKYCGDEDFSFINGVLSGVSKMTGEDELER